MFSVKPDPSMERTLKLLKTLAKRVEHLRGHIAYSASQQFLELVKTNIPTKKEFETYRRSLTVSKVQGAGKGEDIFAVHVRSNARGVKKVDTARTLIYVRVRANRVKDAEDAGVLERYSPWTADSIPFLPKNSDAILTYRKSTPAEVNKTIKARQRDRYKWTKELREVGVRRIPKKDTTIGKTKDLPDVALQAVRMEFGVGGQKPVPHWRPAQRALVQQKLKFILEKDKNIVKTLTDPQFSLWGRWPEKTQQSISMNEAKKFVGFEDKVRIKVSK